MRSILVTLCLSVFLVFNSALAQDNVFVIVEQMPEFNGGKDSLIKHLLRDIKYPKMAAQMGVRGKVTVSYIVDEEGEISDVKVLKGLPGGLNKEAVRLMEDLPPFSPGLQKGQKVKVQMTLQIPFPLEKKVFKGDDKRIVYNKFPNLNDMGTIVFIDDQYYNYIYNKGVESLERKKYAKAIDYFNMCIEMMGTKDANPYFHRGIAKLGMGNESLACGDFRRAKKLWYPGIDKTIKNVCGK